MKGAPLFQNNKFKINIKTELKLCWLSYDVFFRLFFVFVAGIEDVRRTRPGHLEATVDWLRKYKMPDGKPENKFGFNEQFQDKVPQDIYFSHYNCTC